MRKREQMPHFLKKALTDIGLNRFLNLATIFTISLSILVVSIFIFLFENTGRMIQASNQGRKAMVYLKADFTADRLTELQTRLSSLENIEEIIFISKDEALNRLKNEISPGSTFLKTLEGNPLPDALEIRLKSYGTIAEMEVLVGKIKEIDLVEDVEYGQGWLGNFLKMFGLFKTAGYIICALFFLIAFFITSNTVRLAFYSRKTEIEVMRLVGATESFIKTPFYMEGLFQGFFGGILGIGILFLAYLAVFSGALQYLPAFGSLDIRFLSVRSVILIVLISTFLGWFGCYLSLKQILK